MLEIEMKFPVADFRAVQASLTQWNARPDLPLDEADHYFNAPDRDFAKTDEALRIRCIGSKNRITYKGPRQPGPAKTRTEIEIPLADGAGAMATWERLLTHLGYRPVAVVRKQRTIFHFQRDSFDMQVCLDQVEKVGRFVEVEIVAPEEQKAQAEKVLLQIAKELGLGQSERRSYLEMFLERKKDAS